MPWSEWSDTLRARRWWIAVVAVVVLVGVLLLVLRSPGYRATATAVAAVAPHPGPATVTPTEIARTAVALAATPPVRAAAAASAGVDAGEIDVEVTASDAGIVTVAASGSTPERSGTLAGATVGALADTLARLDAAALRATLAPLESQLQDLTAALRATPLGDPGRPPLEGRYAALATVIAERTAAPAPRLLPDGEPVVVAERSPLAEVLLAVLALAVLAAVATLVARGPARERVARARRDRTLALARVDGPHAVLHPGDDVPAVLTRLYADVLRGRGPVLVFQLAAPTARDLGRDLVEAARITGDVLPLRDLSASTPPPVPDDRDEPAIYALRRTRLDGAALGRVRDVGARAAVVAVDTRRAAPARLADTVSLLDGVAVEVRGVVVWRGRFPRAHTPPPALPDARSPGPGVGRHPPPHHPAGTAVAP